MKLLIEIELNGNRIPSVLAPLDLSVLLDRIASEEIDAKVSATVTNDQGEIVRESE